MDDTKNDAAIASGAATAPAEAPSTADQKRVADLLVRLRDNQNFGAALAGGFLGAVIGAVLWALITVATNFEIGWEAVGVGFLVGFGVRILGHGIDPQFGYAGAVLSLFGIALGNVLTGMLIVSKSQSIPFTELASHMDPKFAWVLLTAGLSPIDLLFYGLGVYYGYRYSFHRPTQQELASLR